MESPTPSTPLRVGCSRPKTAPSSSPHTGAVAKMRPVLAALERLTPKVKPVWAVATPKQPRAAIEGRSFRASLLFGSSSRRTRKSKRPPTVNRSATSIRGERAVAAYLVTAKFSSQKVAARTSETSVATAALSSFLNTGADCTPRRPEGAPGKLERAEQGPENRSRTSEASSHADSCAAFPHPARTISWGQAVRLSDAWWRMMSGDIG